MRAHFPRFSFVFTLLLIEFTDELIYGAREAAWPVIRSDFGLTYLQVGILLSVPSIFGNLIESIVGILGDTWKRKTIVLVGGVLFFSGLLSMAYLSVQKLVFNREGFLNPYSFLISMLLVLFGAQGIAYGLFARLFLQLRKELVLTNSGEDSGNVFKEETK